MNEAVRFEQKVHTDDFQVKALKSVAVSPDGKRVAYGALGHLYIKDLPSGAPKRVTNAPGFEFAPRWSADGQWIVYTTWIAAVGRNVAIPSGATQIDVRGKTIMPGIIDAHAHVGGERDGILAQASWPLMANLAFGVTTSHDPSNDTETVFSNAELIRAGQKVGPRVFSTGTILYGAETPFQAVVNTYDDALSTLRRNKAFGAFSVKSYNQQRRDSR